MIKGTYIFYQDGKEIFRSKNVITKFGARYLTNLIAGNVSASKLDMAFGIDSTSATNNDTRLGFEFYRVPISFGSTDIQTSTAGSPPVSTTTYSVVYKTTLPQDVVGKINEIGIYPSTRSSINNFDSKYITDFDDALAWTDSNSSNPSIDTTNYRIGGNLLNFTAVSGNSMEYKCNIVPLDLSGYSVNDDIRIVFYKNDNNLSSLKIRFYSDSTKYYEKVLTATEYGSGSGYKMPDSFTLGNLYSSATNSATLPDKTNINQIGIIVTASGGNTTVGMDGLRINDQDTFDPTFGLISRSVVSPFLNKVGGRPVDVEYRLDLGF